MTDELAWLTRGAGRPRELARIHATVELERALAEHGAVATLAVTAADDPLLGARVVRIANRAPGAVGIAVAEPSTEGRLAAALARDGEGTAGRYVGVLVDLDVVRRLAAAAGVRLSPVETGPYGPEVLVLSSRAAGPHVLLVDVRAVPSPE